MSASISPYKVKVLPTHDASKVRASGPGLNTTGVPASLPVEFTIDAKDAGEGLLAVQITVSAPVTHQSCAHLRFLSLFFSLLLVKFKLNIVFK